MLKAFIAGEDLTREFVRRLEGEFAACGLDDDDRFADLQYALAMFGAGARADDEQLLTTECRRALALIEGIRDT